MNPVTFKASDYNSRRELDNDVLARVGNSIFVNSQSGHVISGTEDELKALSLSANSRVFGVGISLQNS